MEPDVFKCSVSDVGVYDLVNLFKKGDIFEPPTPSNFIFLFFINNSFIIQEPILSPDCSVAQIKTFL